MLCSRLHRPAINAKRKAIRLDELRLFRIRFRKIVSFSVDLFKENSLPFDSFAASDLYKISSSYRVHQMNAQNRQNYQTTDPLGGDIMTRVAIPRSGSFLNTSGLARYKSQVRRPGVGKSGGGG